jgi:hypothetical protein
MMTIGGLPAQTETTSNVISFIWRIRRTDHSESTFFAYRSGSSPGLRSPVLAGLSGFLYQKNHTLHG